MRRFAAFFATLAVVAGLSFSLWAPQADAGATSMGDEIVVSGQSSVTGATQIAVVVTASSGQRLRVRSMVLNASAAGDIVFESATTGTDLCHVYLEANKPFVFDEELLGPGFATVSGESLSFYDFNNTTNTLTYTMRIHRD